jgi:hypothetical protein
MSNSTQFLDLIAVAQASKEITANALFDAMSPAAIFGRREAGCSGLTWAYYGGWMYSTGGTLQQIQNGTVTLTASANNRVEVDNAGSVFVHTNASFTPGRLPLYLVVTGTASVTSWQDYRALPWPIPLFSRALETVTTADVTVTLSARADYIEVAGALTGNRNLILPANGQWSIFNNTTGAFTLTVKTASGTGVAVGQTKRCILIAYGTNVVRLTPDV